MGILDRFRKEERLHIDPETRETGWIPVKKTHEIKELTREEQMEPRRMHPWQTPRGKRVIKDVGSGIQKVDRAIVRYNRRQPAQRRPPVYSNRDNYNPFGTQFDTGMSRPRPQKKKTKYVVVGGKAYPKAGTGKKKKKSRRKSYSNYDPFNAFGGYKF